MGKSKKFIDKKNSVTFYLAHRSQKDPLIADENAPQRVLVPVEQAGGTRAESTVGAGTSKSGDKELSSKESRKAKQLEYGIYFDDDYDYLQHLKDVEEVSTIEWDIRERIYAPKVEETREAKEMTPRPGTSKAAALQFPSSVFQSEFEEKVGLLNKAVESTGPRPDLDPDVLAALDDDFDYEDPDNELEDNFMELATGGVRDLDDEISDTDRKMKEIVDSDDEEDFMDEDADKVGELNRSFSESSDEDRENTRFTNYSMSSSVLRRNEQLTLLDDRFEKMFEDYDDTEIGALDCDEIEGHLDPQSQMLLKYASEHEKEAEEEVNLKEKIENLVLKQDEEDEGNDEDRSDDSDEPKEKWDCESILSTYSTTKNRPKLIKEPSKKNPIKVSGKTQIPVDTLGLGLTKAGLKELDAEYEMRQGNTESNAKSMISSISAMRRKDETPEERARRKKLLREYRNERRAEKKANANAFKDEKKRQEKVRLNNVANVQGLKI